MPRDPPIWRVMLSILDLNPRPEEKLVASPAKEGRSFTGSAPPLPTAVSDAGNSGPNESPERLSATESTKATKPATPPEPMQQSAQPGSSATLKSPPPKPRAENVPVSEPVNIPEAAAAETEPRPVPAEEGEFEVVLGRRQIASWLFVGTVLIAVFSAAAYFVGKTPAPNCVGALADQTVPYVAPPLPAASILPPGQEPNLDASAGLPSEVAKPFSAAGPASAVPQAPVVSVGPILAAGPVGPAVAGSSGAAVSIGPVMGPTAGPAPALVEPPIFAQPQPGALYLQMGAVDKGVAVVLAEGLRRQGFTSLVAPGPTEKIFRVLIGPLENQDAYRRVKAQVNAIDLSTFARRFQK